MKRSVLVVVAVACAGMFPAFGSDPPSHDVRAPATNGASVRISWTGAIPPGANTNSSCVNAAAVDEHAINLAVPAGLYRSLIVRATFAISWSGATDGIITVLGPDGSAVNGDNGFVDADEFVRLVNPKPGAYQVRACAFAGAAPQTYTGSLELLATLPGVCPTDVVRGIDLQTATIPQIQTALASGATTSRALVEAYLARIALFDTNGPKLNSIRALSPGALTAAAALDAERRAGKVRGPLHGIPVVLKDNIGTRDMPTTAGSIALAGSIPLREAFLTERLRAAGAIILGKTNLSEFANWVDPDMPSGYSSLGGQVLNAFHFGDPSGSSSGSGVAASMALATATIGTETSGSILSPSVASGIVGIKPTVGLVSRAGVIPLAATFDTPGPMTRTVTDAAIVLGAIAGVDVRDPKTADASGKIPPGSDYRPFLKRDGLSGTRIGVSDADRDGLGAEAQALWDKVLETLTGLGATVVHSDNVSNLRNVGLAEIAVIPNEFKHGLNHYLATETVPDLRVKTLADIIAYNAEHPDKVKYGQRWLQISDATLGNVDEPTAVASRTAAIAASQAAVDATMAADDLDAILAPGNINANIGAAALYPSITVPAGTTAGGTQPFGVTFLGPAFGEPQLISFAYAYEQASRRRSLPTKANRGLCPARSVTKATTGGPAAPPRVKGARHTLPSTGVGSSAAGLVLLALACGLAVRLSARPTRRGARPRAQG